MFCCTCRAWAATVSAERAAASASLFEATQCGTVVPPGCPVTCYLRHPWTAFLTLGIFFGLCLAFGKLFQCRLHRRPWPCCDPLGCLADNRSVKRASAPPVIADCLRLVIFGESLICVAALLSMIGFSVMYCGILLGSSSHPNLSSTLLIGDGQEGWGGHPRPHSFLADSLASRLKSSWHAPLFESSS